MNTFHGQEGIVQLISRRFTLLMDDVLVVLGVVGSDCPYAPTPNSYKEDVTLSGEVTLGCIVFRHESDRVSVDNLWNQGFAFPSAVLGREFLRSHLYVAIVSDYTPLAWIECMAVKCPVFRICGYYEILCSIT